MSKRDRIETGVRAATRALLAGLGTAALLRIGYHFRRTLVLVGPGGDVRSPALRRRAPRPPALAWSVAARAMTVVQRLQATGIRRSGSPARGFRYRTAGGGAPSWQDRRRIRALAVPPAWTDAWISAAASSSVQAIGKDRAGRWQYFYSARHARRREERKRERLLAFLQTLPQIRARVARDLRAEGLGRERVLAAMVRILLRGFVRPGQRRVHARERHLRPLDPAPSTRARARPENHAGVHGQGAERSSGARSTTRPPPGSSRPCWPGPGRRCSAIATPRESGSASGGAT